MPHLYLGKNQKLGSSKINFYSKILFEKQTFFSIKLMTFLFILLFENGNQMFKQEDKKSFQS